VARASFVSVLLSLGVAAALLSAPAGYADDNSDGTASPLLDDVAAQIALPDPAWTATGTHTARGYTTQGAAKTSAAGMKADCDNINLNKKLAADFRSDVFGPGMKGFFFKCEAIAPDTNKYWFTISSADPTQIDRLCDPATAYPIVYDSQHNTWWIDEPFTCTARFAPS
jgi:hypothetical protein